MVSDVGDAVRWAFMPLTYSMQSNCEKELVPNSITMRFGPAHLNKSDARATMPLVRCTAFVRTFDDFKHSQSEAGPKRFVFKNSVWGPQGRADFAQALRVQVPTEINQGRVTVTSRQPGRTASQRRGFEWRCGSGEMLKGRYPDLDKSDIGWPLGLEYVNRV